MDMVAGASGYTNTLQVDLPRTEISSSINHELLWRSGAQRISCDLSAPLVWNGLRQWYFNIVSEDLELFLLRDHIFLLIDLVDDWTAGPPADYLIFTPFKYYMDLQLKNVKLYLNVNDANVINNPTDMDDNTYLILGSPLLKSTTCIPIDHYRPNKNAIPFDVQADILTVGLHLPPWNTQATFLPSTNIGHVENLALDGRYEYNATTSSANTDTLVLSLTAQSPVATIHGFVIRYFLKLKDNYFGDDVHFKTLEEYQEALQVTETNPEAESTSRNPRKKSNDLDVILNIRVDDPKAIIPGNLYAEGRHVQIDTACFSCDLRFTNYYMDMDLHLTPLNVSLGSHGSGLDTPIGVESSTQLFIDGVNIYGNRLFGLPPTEPTYLCNWDVSAGAVTGECSAEFLSTLLLAARAFIFTFDDDENALVSYSSIVFYDVTFLRAFVPSVSIWLHVEDAAFLFSTGAIDVRYNDWARSHYSKRANINIPDIRISCVNSDSATRSKARSNHPVETNALIQTTLNVAMIGRKFQFSSERKLQQTLVRKEDQRTHRTPFLMLPGLLEELVPDPVDPPAQCFPPIPQPILSDHLQQDDKSSSSSISAGTSRRSKALDRKSSFLSFSSSGQSSIVRPLSSKRSSLRRHRPDILQPLTTLDQRLDRANRSSIHAREVSASTGRHSAFYSTAGDVASDRQDVIHNTVAFSSQYFAPYFALQNVVPDTREATLQSIEEDNDEDATEPVGFNLEDIDQEILSEDCSYTSIMVDFPSGVAVFVNPTSLRHVAALVTALLPTEPEEILDTLQLDAMTDIFDMQKEQKMKGHVADLLIRVPRANVRFISSLDLDATNPPHDDQDQYDFSLTKLALASRSESQWGNAFKPETRKNRKSFHVRVQSAGVSASERLRDADGAEAAFSARVQDVMLSMGSKDVTYLDVDINSIQSNTSSSKINYLGALIQRTTAVASELGKVFEESTAHHNRLVKYLAHRLIMERQSAPDPVFLVRPSAVLRSARQHLRTFDSWKVIMHLRQMWSSMDYQGQEQLKMDCLGCLSDLPHDLREEAIASFLQWRSWDLEDLSESVLLHRMFGRPEPKDVPPSNHGPMLAVIRVKEIHLALDSGPKPNEIIFADITARLENKQITPRLEDDDPSAEISPEDSTVVNLYCGDASVSLNWELCELVDDVLKVYNTLQSRQSRRSSGESSPASVETKISNQKRTIHFVMLLYQGSVALETINIHATTLCSGLKVSLLMNLGAAGGNDESFVLSCDSLQSRLRNRDQGLVRCVMHKPSILVSHQLQSNETTDSHTIKATASCQDLTMVVRQDPVALSEVLDSVIRDEVAQLYLLKQQIPSAPAPSSPNKTIADRLSAVRVNLAMFMDEYTIKVPLLRSITYVVTGTVCRASMAANFGKEIIFDFDINENSHEMQVTVNNVPRGISLLQIPPTNGRVTSQMSSGEHSISVFASLELVQLDASAVYSLLSALNRPEISSAINEIQQQSKIIQERIADVFGTEDEPVKKEDQGSARVLVYAVHMTLAGIEVFGNSSLKSELAPIARISFCLDSVHLGMTNRVDQDGPLLAFPEVHVNLRRIDFEIQKGTTDELESCGNVSFGALVTATSRQGEDGREMRFFDVKSDGFEVNLSPDTVSTVFDVLAYMGDKIKDLDTSREVEYLRKIRHSRPRITINDEEQEEEPDIIDAFLSSITYTFEVCDIRISWLVAGHSEEDISGKEDLVLSLERIEFGTRTNNSARLTIENLQLQMVPSDHDWRTRSSNSALLPELIFNVAYISTSSGRRLAFQAVGKSLDLRLNSGFIVPAANLNESIGLSIKNARQASQNWNPVISTVKSPTESHASEDLLPRSLFGNKKLESLLVDVDFAGAVVHLTSKKNAKDADPFTRLGRPNLPGRFGQFSQDESSSTVLRTPGLAWKIEYTDNGKDDPSLYAEVKIDASSNILYPSVVPLIVDMTNSVKEVVRSDDDDEEEEATHEEVQDGQPKTKPGEEDNILTADPSAVLGRLKLNIGLRICKQEFSLSCQPIARVAATASFGQVYFTVNTVSSVEQGNFFAISGAFTDLQASVQHVYSRESTGSFEVESIVLSLINSKHVSGSSGVSAILKVSPMKVSVNARQLQDFLLFREIWVPREISKQSSSAPVAKLVTETSQGHLVQRYQQVAATAAFPWTATISIAALEINVDLGQALGKSVFSITEFWISSKKTSDWEQNLCLGFQKIGVDSAGRMSGFIYLENFQMRTSIQWPEREQALNETPLIQASIGFGQFRVKAAFDYQAFLVADITSMTFLMYNVRQSLEGSGDRLVAIFDGDAVQVFGTTTSAAQAIALYQAFQRLVQERKASLEASLKEIERFMRRRSTSIPVVARKTSRDLPSEDDVLLKSPISLDTDVVVTLKALNLGVYPSTFSDHQVFKMEALNAQARFAASIDDRRIHSILGLTLGQLRIGLADVRQVVVAKTLKELLVEDVVLSATGSRGGTILKVPRVEAVMQTWQSPQAKQIDYIFKSAFEGKVEVGWNYSRISYIRGMWANHSKTLAHVWGKELPPVTAIRVTGVPEPQTEDVKENQSASDQQPSQSSQQSQTTKITAEVNVPQSKYEYRALEPPIIETPQLRDMGEATPPLEWIGLHRDRLPNLTHQIVIVSLLELAGEVEDAYSRILGSS
jgi:hypothetical protein